MYHFSIDFAYPWLLLLLIPAFGLTFFLYFRLNKRYRRTRNRIISMVLHSIVITLAILVLAGIQFHYQVANLENEIILLVDVSETEECSSDRREQFIETILTEGQYDNFKIGIVTFGFTQQYAVPLTYEVDTILEQYHASELPDTSATDIAAALRYTRDLFEHPDTSKIVLVTDGKETDEIQGATSIIRSIAMQGTKVDTVYISSAYENDNMQITGAQLPDYHVNVGDECSIYVNLQSKISVTGATLELYDNDVLAETQIVDIALGAQSVMMSHTFETDQMHELKFKLTVENESLEQNNEYYSYLYLEVYDKVLIIEQKEGESEQLKQILENGEPKYSVSVLNLHDSEGAPTDVDGLRAYDQIILNNISNEDLQVYAPGLDENLYQYVYEFGGGLFTVGGNDDEGNAHAYNRLDMNNSLYQQMLPVQAINYTPPVGVIVVIDISGSMLSEGTDGYSKLEWAKQGAISCLDALTERDYIGIMTLDDEYGTILRLTQRTQETLIKEAILGIGEGGGTVFSNAIDRAGTALINEQRVERRHIILVTDGMPTGNDKESYLSLTDNFYRNNGITLSVVGIDISEGSEAFAEMQQLVATGHGRLHTVSDERKLLEEMREDLNVPEIKEVNYEPFLPTIQNEISPVIKGVARGEEGENRRKLTFELDGFYGVKARDLADTVLVGEFGVPIYSQWKFGRGTVGSFMCDLSGAWSGKLVADENGQLLVRNIIATLMPTENIRPKGIVLSLQEENYINHLTVSTELGEGETIRGRIVREDGESTSMNVETPDIMGLDCYIMEDGSLNAANYYTYCNFVIKAGGVYTIIVEKCNAAGEVIDSVEMYKSFAYSQEYNIFAEETADPAELLNDLAEKGNGSVIDAEENPWAVFADFATDLDRSYDPRLVFMIIAMVLFLLDIAVRKFKFKWIHELVRERRERRAGTAAERKG